MKIYLLLKLLSSIFPKMDGSSVKYVADRILDAIEDRIADSESKTDDRFIVPLIAAFRLIADIPDDEDQYGNDQ